MSETAPLHPPTAQELRRVLAWSVDRISSGGGCVSCTGLDTATEQALYRFLMDRSPDALAAAYAANERRIAGWLPTV